MERVARVDLVIVGASRNSQPRVGRLVTIDLFFHFLRLSEDNTDTTEVFLRRAVGGVVNLKNNFRTAGDKQRRAVGIFLWRHTRGIANERSAPQPQTWWLARPNESDNDVMHD